MLEKRPGGHPQISCMKARHSAAPGPSEEDGRNCCQAEAHRVGKHERKHTELYQEQKEDGATEQSRREGVTE